MKKLLAGIMILAATAVLTQNVSALTPAVSAQPAQNIRVTVDGRVVNFTDQAPVAVEGRTLVPVRGVFQEMGFEVVSNRSAQTVVLTRGYDTIIFLMDSDIFTVNGAAHTLEVPAQNIGGRAMIPLRAVVQAIGYNVEFLRGRGEQTVAVSTHRAEPGDEAQLNFTARYERTNVFYWDIAERDYPFIITSMAELAEFLTPHATHSLWTVRENGTYIEILMADRIFGVYDEEFFENNFLVIIYIMENSGSNRHSVDAVYANGDVHITRLLPEIGTHDMAGWHIILELENTVIPPFFNIHITSHNMYYW